MLLRISRSNEQKHAKSCIDCQNPTSVCMLWLMGLPAPTRRPQGHHERMYPENKDQPNENQSYPQIANSCPNVQISPPQIVMQSLASTFPIAAFPRWDAWRQNLRHGLQMGTLV